MKQKSKIQFLIILIVFSFLGCSTTRMFDVIMYSNQKYKKTDIDKILVVKSRLAIKEKYYEIGVIKATNRTNLQYIKEVASRKGANIIIDEGNLNFTLARYKKQKEKESDNEKGVTS